MATLPPAARIGSFSEKWPPKPTWKAPEDVPDLTGQIFLVTGGNAGIGKETCRILLARNAKVYLATRSEERARASPIVNEPDMGLTCGLTGASGLNSPIRTESAFDVA
ncbi:hypothetical protein FB45DRAFT_861328 [Roridomyces roridus]|uniref:Uncharacterized protein n=1 Tax=Roridomyces roridus TaxID=1738132 RepID=A0AAD7CAB2_9AGAR|nr:hypothetical protein FB45DRAFT_861328 [Roridomyces roridus]